MTTLRLDIPDTWWTSSNDRLHWAQRATRTRHIRQYAALRARAEHVPTYDVALIIARIQYPTARKADPFNAAPVIKAAVDGLVDAGVFPDDDSRHVIGPAPVRMPGKSKPGTYRVDLILTDQEVPW